jgi:dihydroneopterin aldolase
MPDQKPAIIRMNKLIFYGYHGNSKAEKETGRRYEVDCEFNIDITRASQTDSLDDTIDYSQVYQIIDEVITNNKFNLIETLADRIADAVINIFNVDGVKLRVRKMTPPIPGNIEYIEVETERSR